MISVSFIEIRNEPATIYALPRSGMMESLIVDANAHLTLDKDSFANREVSRTSFRCQGSVTGDST